MIVADEVRINRLVLVLVKIRTVRRCFQEGHVDPVNAFQQVSLFPQISTTTIIMSACCTIVATTDKRQEGGIDRQRQSPQQRRLHPLS